MHQHSSNTIRNTTNTACTNYIVKVTINAWFAYLRLDQKVTGIPIQGYHSIKAVFRVHCVTKAILLYHNESRLEYSKLHKLGHNKICIELL